MRRKRKRLWPFFNKFLNTVFDLLIIFGVILLLQQYVFSVGRVIGASMEPTLTEDQRLVIDRVSYKIANPKRFDIVAVKFPSEDSYWVKRIIGLPGERIDYMNGTLFVDGTKTPEPFLGPGVVTDNFSTNQLFPDDGAKIPKGQYLVLGDNRGHSKDGRLLGTLGKDDILGVARLSVYPLDRIKILNVRSKIIEEVLA
jgi:signal peptidase I